MQVSSAMEEQDGEMVVKRLSVPVGLEELMTGLTREVLQKKPKDLYTFASEHFGQLLALRDNGNYRNPPSRSFAFFDQNNMENRTPNGNLRKSRSGGGSGRQLSRQVSIRAESPVRKSRIRRSGTPKHDDNNNSEGKTKVKQDKNKAARRQTPGSKSKFDNLKPVKEDSLKVVAKKENLQKRSIDKKSKDSSGSKDSKRSSSEESERLKKKGENFSETKGKTKTIRKELGEDSAKFVPKSSSVEEATTGIKDGRLTVTPPKIIKEAQSPTDQLDLPTTLVVPVLTAASSCLSVDAGKKESGQDEDIRKALKNDSETGEILSVSKEDSQDSSSKNYDSSILKKELKKVEEEAKLNNFTTSYNPYKLRQEINNVSKEANEYENVDALGTESAAGKTQSPHVNLTPNLQHSGELHDTIIPQEGSAEDSINDKKVLEDKDELNSKELKKIAHIGLQHSGELHDSLIPKEKETVKKDESMEAIKTPIQLQHSSELHDTVISKETENINGESQEKVETSLARQQEKVIVKDDKPMEAINTPIQLQHTSELHDTVISKETENINGESQEKVETPLALQHSGELHDTVISEDIITEDEKDQEIHNVQVTESPTSSLEKEASVAESTLASAAAAATKIQSLWRGFRVRKMGRAKVDELVDQHNVPESEISGNRGSLSNDDIMHAATKIQASVRGYLMRKQQKNKISATKENASADEELHKALAQLDNAPIPNESPELARHKRDTQVEDFSDVAVVKADDREENSTVTDKLARSKSVRELGSGKLNVPPFSKSFSVTDSAISKTLDDDEEKLRSLTEDTESLGEQTEDLGIESEMSSTQQFDQGKITEEVLPDNSHIIKNKKIIEEPAFVTASLHYSGELYDTVVYEESKQNDDSSVIPQGGESIQELPSKILPSDIVKEQTTSKELPELASTSNLQHSGELHDRLIPKDINITEQDPQNENLSSPHLQQSTEIHDTVIINKSDKQGSVVDDNQLAEIESQVEQPHDISTTHTNKPSREEELLPLIGLQHSSELRDIAIPKKKENGSSGNDNGQAIPQMSTQEGYKLIVNESETAEEGTDFTPYTLHHSSELHDTVIPKDSKENKDIQADTGLIAGTPHLAETSPDIAKIKNTETNAKGSRESICLEHRSELHDTAIPKTSEERKDIQTDTGLIDASQHLAVESQDISKIKETDTNAKDTSESTSLEHSSELHDTAIPKISDVHKYIQTDTGLIDASQHLTEESPDISKIKETETNAKCSSESISLEHSSELHDTAIPKTSEEHKDIPTDTGLIDASQHLPVESPDISKIKETDMNAKNTSESTSLEHSRELHDTAIPKASEEHKDIQRDTGLIDASQHLTEESQDISKIKETDTNAKDTSESTSLEHSSELHDTAIPNTSEEHKDIPTDTGLIDASQHLAEESPDISKIKETETNAKASSESISLEHSSELHDTAIPKTIEENKHIQTDTGLITASQHLAEESPNISKIKETETNAKDTFESTSLEHSSELHDTAIPKTSEEHKDIPTDTGLTDASQHLAEESPDISKIKETETNARDTSESTSLEHSSELHDTAIPKTSEEHKYIPTDTGLIDASQHLAEESSDISKIKETETNAKASSESISLEHSSELHDTAIPKTIEENKHIQTDTGLITASQHLAEESPNISKIKETETNAKDTFESTSLEHSSELHDTAIPKTSEEHKDIPTDTGLTDASQHLAEESPDISKIKETETNARDTSESTSLEHSSELHDTAIPKTSEEHKYIPTDTGLIDASQHLAEESPDISKIKETETNAKCSSESISLEHSSELHDTAIPKTSEEHKDIPTDTGLIDASQHLPVESPDISKIKETDMNAKNTSESTSLEHSRELHDTAIPKASEEHKDIQRDTGLIDASQHLTEESQDISKIKETDTNAKDTSESTSLEHSSELHDTAIPNTSEEHKDIPTDTGLIDASQHLAEESPDISKIKETETNAKASSESISLEHSSELHDTAIPKTIEENKHIQTDTGLITASQHLAEESPNISKIKETETNAKDTFESTSLEHSSELHDTAIPKTSEEHKDIPTDTGLTDASQHLAEESPDISKIKETETNARDTSESTSLEHSSELHDTAIPKTSEEHKYIPTDTGLIDASQHLAEESSDISKIKETETNAKASSESISLEHSSELHDTAIPKTIEENKHIQTDTGLITASQHLAEESPNISKIKETETNAKDTFESTSLEHSSELHDTAIPKTSEEHKDIPTDTGLTDASQHLAEESPDISKIKETETNARDTSESTSLEHSSELHDTAIPKTSEEHKYIPTDTGLIDASQHLAEESPDISKIKETETNAKDTSESTSLEHSSELQDIDIPKTSEEHKDIPTDTGLIDASQHLAEESPDISKIKETETNAIDTSESTSLEHSSELHDTAIPKTTEEHKDIPTDTGLIDASQHLTEESPDISKIKESETNAKGSSDSISLEHSSELHDTAIPKTSEENKDIQTDNTGLIAGSPHLAEESPDIAKIKETETNAKGSSESIPLEHSSELHDTAIPKTSDEHKDIPTDTGLIDASQHLAEESPDISKIKETETNAKDTFESTSLEHSSELHDTAIPKTSDEHKDIPTDTGLIDASQHLAEESPDISKIKETETNAKDTSESTSLEHSSELHDTAIPKTSEEHKDIQTDTGLIDASQHLTEESPDISKIKETETNAKDTSESTSLEHSSELHDTAIPKTSEEHKYIPTDTGLIDASQHLAEEAQDISKIKETEMNAKDTSESTSLEHSSELHDIDIPKTSEEHKDIPTDTGLIDASQHLAEESPDTSKIKETETNAKDTSESTSLEHSSELHDTAIPKTSEENKDIQTDNTGLIAGSPHLAEESPDIVKIKETETNAKGSSESISLEHSSELHDTAIPKTSDEHKDIQTDTDLVDASQYLTEELPDISKIKETEKNPKHTSESTSLEYSSHDTAIPKTSEEHKYIQTDTGLIDASQHLTEEPSDILKIKEIEKNVKDTSESISLEHSSELHDAITPKESEEKKGIRSDTGLTAAIPHLAEESTDISKIKETETNAKASPESISLQHSSELHDTVIPTTSIIEETKRTEDMLVSNMLKEKEVQQDQSPQLTTESQNIITTSEEGNSKPTTFQHSNELRDTVIPNEIEQEKSLVMSSPLLTAENKSGKPNGENNSVPVAVEHTSELTNDLVPIAVEEGKSVQESHKLAMQSLPYEEESQNTVILNKTEKDSEKGSAITLEHSNELLDTVTPDKMKDSENSSEQDSSTPVATQNGNEMSKILAASTVDEQKTVNENQNLVAMSPQLVEESHATSSLNEVEKVSERGNPTSITLQHSSELHDPVISNETEEKGSLKMPRPASTEVEETEKPVADGKNTPTIALQHSSEVRDAEVAKEAAVSTIATVHLTEEPHNVSKIKGIEQPEEEDKSTLSTSLQHISELRDSIISNEVKKAECDNILEMPKSNNELGDTSEVKAIKTDVKDDNGREIDVAMEHNTDENKYVKTTEETEEIHKQSPATTHHYDGASSNDTKKHQTAEDDTHVASEIPLPTEGMDKSDENSIDKISINHKSLKSIDVEQDDDMLLNSNKHQKGTLQNDDDLATTSPQSSNQPRDIGKVKESEKADEMGKSSTLTILQHSSELHDTLMPIEIEKETLQDNTKLITEVHKKACDSLTENVIDASDEKDKRNQPRTSELNKTVLSNVSLEEPIPSDKPVTTVVPQLGDNLQNSLDVKQSDLLSSSLSHSGELHDTVIPEAVDSILTVDDTLLKRSDLKVEKSLEISEQTEKIHQKGDNRSAVGSPNGEKTGDLLIAKENNQNKEADLSKDVEMSKRSDQQNNTLEEDAHLPTSRDGDVLNDVEQQKQTDEIPKQENLEIVPLQHSSEFLDVLIPKGIEERNDLSQTHQNLQSDILMSKDQDNKNDVTSKEKYKQSHLSLVAADPHGDEHGGLIASRKEDLDVSTRKKISESKQTSGDRKSASNDVTRESEKLEPNVEQQDLEPKKGSHVYHQVDKQEPTNSITDVPDLNEPTNLQHSGELHDLIFPPGDVNNKSNIDNNHVIGTTKLQSEKDGEGHQSPEHYNESGEAPPTSGLQHSGEFHDLLIPQADNFKQEDVRSAIDAITSAEDTFENKIVVGDVTKPNGYFVSETPKVDEKTGENSIKLQDEGSAVKDSEDGRQSADGSKTLAAQNQVQNVEVGKDDSNGHDIILNKQISSSVLDVPLECEAPASSTTAASGALSDDVQRDNYNLHHKTDEEAKGQPVEKLNSLSPIQDPHSRNIENRKDALYNSNVDIQQPTQSSTELTTEELLNSLENIDSDEDQNKLDSEEKEVKEILQKSANNPSTHIIDVKGNNVNDVNNKKMENKNHNNEELHSKTEEFDKNLNKELEPLTKQAGHISSDFDMTALRAELASVESEIENTTNGSSIDNIEGKDNKLDEPVSSKTFDIVQLHSELENIVAKQPDEDKHESTENDIIKHNITLENAPAHEKANREELNSTSEGSNYERSKITREIDGQKDALAEVTQAKANDSSLLNKDSTEENKSKQLKTEVFSNSKIEDKHEEKAVGTNLASESSDVDSKTVAEKAKLPNMENDKQYDISWESIKEKTLHDDISGRSKPLVNEEVEEKELEKTSTEVKDVLKYINDQHKPSGTKALNDDVKKVDDEITEDKQSSQIAQDKQQSLSNTENLEKDSKNSTKDTLVNEVSEGATKQEIAELALQNINSEYRESMDVKNAENIPNKSTSIDRNCKKEDSLTSTKEGLEGKIEENLIKDDNASGTFDISKLRAELEKASNVLQSEANLKENTEEEDLHNQKNQVHSKIEETVNKLSIEDDKTESSKGVIDNAISLKTSQDNDDSINGKENLEKTLIPDSTNPSTFDISTLRAELEEMEKQIENETNTTEYKSGETTTSKMFDILTLRSELEKLETDENGDKSDISNDIDKLNKTNKNDLNETRQTANKLSQDKVKKFASEGSANVSESGNLSSPPHAVESKSEKASTNESLAIDYESAPTRPATSDITPSISLNENIQIPSDNVYKHAQATDLEPHNSAEIITSGGFKGEGNDEKIDLGPGKINKQDVDVHINDKINEGNFKDAILKSFSVAELNPKDQLDNATKDKLKLEEEIERPVSISSTTSTDSAGTVIFNASSPREIDDDAGSYFKMPQKNESQKSKDNKANLHVGEEKQPEGVNKTDDRHNDHEVVPNNNILQNQGINELDADDVKENSANSKDVKLINGSPVIPVEVTPGEANALDKGIKNNVMERMSDIEEKVDSVDGSNSSAVTASEQIAISGEADVPQEATSNKDLDTNKINVSTVNKTTFIEGSNGYTAQELDKNKVNLIKIHESNLQKESSNEDRDVIQASKELVTPKETEIKTMEHNVLANAEKEDNSNAKHIIANNLDVVQSIDSNEKTQDKKIAQNSGDIFKEPNNLQGVVTNKDLQIKINEDAAILGKTKQTGIKHSEEQPEISRAKLTPLVTSPSDFVNRNDEDADVPTNIEPTEKTETKEIQNSEEELSNLQDIETNKASVVKANERYIDKISQFTKEDGFNSKIVSKNKEDEKPGNTLSKLAPDETTLSNVKNEKYEVKESVPDPQKTLKENNNLQEIEENNSLEANASEDNIIRGNDFQITKQDEIGNKNELTEESEIALSKLALDRTSPAKLKNKDANNIITSNLHGEQNIGPNEKVDVKEIPKESNNLQETETNGSSGEANEDYRTTENASQITKQDEISAEVVTKNELKQEPKLTSSKLSHIQTLPSDIKDKDIVPPNLDAVDNIEANETVDVKEVATNSEKTLRETNNVQEMKSNKSPEAKSDKDNITETVPQITLQDEISSETVSKKGLKEEPKITSSKLAHVETSHPDIKNKNDKDIITPNLDAAENIETRKEIDFKEIIPNAEETFKGTSNLQELEVEKSLEVKENEGNIITATSPQITTHDEMNFGSVNNNKPTEEPKITSMKLVLVEGSPADIKNKDDKDIPTPNLDVAENTEANKNIDAKEIAPNPEETLKEANTLQKIEANKSPEVKSNADNIITENAPRITIPDKVNSEIASKHKRTEEPKITSAKLTLVETSPADVKNKDEKDIVTPNLDATPNNEANKKDNIAPNSEATLKVANILMEMEANKTPAVKANEDNLITETAPQIITQDEVRVVSKNKLTEEPQMTLPKLTLVEKSLDVKNKNDKDMVTPNLDTPQNTEPNKKTEVKKIDLCPEETLKETNDLQEIETNNSSEGKANEDNIIIENASQIITQEEVNSESTRNNKSIEEPKITSAKLTFAEVSPVELKNNDDTYIVTPNLDANEKSDIKELVPNHEETLEGNKSPEVKANKGTIITENDSPITIQDEMNSEIVSKNEIKKVPEITSSKSAVVETPPVDVKNEDDQRIISPDLNIAQNIEPKEKVKPKEIASNVEENLGSNNLQEIEANKSSEVKANVDNIIAENTSQIKKQDAMNELEENPENISSKLAGIETPSADFKNYEKDMITHNFQLTKHEMNTEIVSKNEQEEEQHITSAKSAPVETSFPDVRNDNDKYMITPNLDVAQKNEPHEAGEVKGTVSNAKEIINKNEATSEIVKNNEQQKDTEKKGDTDAITTDSNVAEHTELNEKPEIKEVVQDPEESNNLQAIETNKDSKIKTNEESTTAESVPHFIIKEDVKTMVTSKDKQEEMPKTTSPDLALAETLSSDSKKKDDKYIKDNITNNINDINDVQPKEHEQIVEKTEPIREMHLEIKNKSIDKSTEEKLLKNIQEADPSEEHKTIVKAIAIEEVASKENNDNMDKIIKGQVTGINDEDLPVEQKELVQDKKVDQNRLDNSVTLLQEEGAHLNQDEAATKIQSGYRGYRVRRSFTMPLSEISSTKIYNDSNEVNEYIKNTQLRHVDDDNNKVIQQDEASSKIELSPDVSTKFLNTDKNLIQNATPAAAGLSNQKKTLIRPGDPKQSEDIKSTSPPLALTNFEDEDDSYDPFKHASAPPLSLLDHEEEFDLHNQSMLASHPPEQTIQTAKTVSLDSKEKQRTAVDKIMDVASAPTHLSTSKFALYNKLSPAAEGIDASQKVKEEDVHVPSVEQPEGVSPRFHNDKDGPVTQALEIVLDQQLALATPSAVKKKESVESEGPEYIYIPLKDPKVSSPSKSLSEGLQHSGEYHDSVVVPLLTNAPSKDASLDATSLAEPKEQKINNAHAISSDSIVDEEEDSSKYDLVDSHTSPRTQIENEGAVTKALGTVLDQQLAITTPKAKPKEEESSEEPKYIYIPLKDPNQESSFEEKDLTETKHEESVSEQVGDTSVSVPVRHYETMPQMETTINVHNKDSATNNVEKHQEELSLAQTIDVTPNTSPSEKTKTDMNNEAYPVSVVTSVEKEDEGHSSLTQSIDATPKTSSSEEAQPLTESKTEVLATPGQSGQASGATTFVLSSNLADAASSPVVITHQPSARSGSADIRGTVLPGTPTLGLQVRFSPSPTQNVEEISASVSPIGERREGLHSTQEDRSVQSESPPLVIQTTQISDVLPVAVQLNQPPGQVFIIISPKHISLSSRSSDGRAKAEWTGAAVLTSPTRSDAGASVTAHAPSGGASTKDRAPGGGAHFQLSMETGNRAEAHTNGENMEELAATKIQASFRGYQVRKQLKCKNGGVESLRRSLRRKSSGKLRGSDKASQKAPKNTDLEEKSATKIQAGVRGFLVRRRQKKAKGNSSPESS